MYAEERCKGGRPLCQPSSSGRRSKATHGHPSIIAASWEAIDSELQETSYIRDLAPLAWELVSAG